MSALEALRASSSLTEEVKWNLLLFWLAIIGLNILGAICLGIGLLVTVPMSLMAQAMFIESWRAKRALRPDWGSGKRSRFIPKRTSFCEHRLSPEVLF